MKTIAPLHRFRSVGLVLLAECLLLPVVWHFWNTREHPAQPAGQFTTIVSTTHTLSAARGLPFTFDDVVTYFRDALGFPPQQRFTNEAVFQGGTSEENFYTVTITRRGADLVVAFKAVDDYGMNLVREFFEAPFFLPRESEQFYGLLTGRDLSRTLHFNRFDLSFDYICPDFEADITMVFSPRIRAVTDL